MLYVRVSTDDQARRGYSLPEQLEECRRRAVELGAQETIDIVDDAGGDFLERPGLERAREVVRSGAVHWFICLDPDRFSRNLLNQLLVTDEIDRHGVELCFCQHHREKTAEGNLFYAIRGAIAEFEKAKILERTQRGKRGKAKRGLLPGYCDPYGYVMDVETDRLVIDEAEARWVRQLFRWAADPDPGERMGPAQISRQLSLLGIPAPRGRVWYRSTVAGILRNEIYKGTLYWGRRDHTGVYQGRRAGAPAPRPTPRPPEQWLALAVPPIISVELFAAVQARLGAAQRRPAPQGKHLLAGLAFCGLCGARMQAKQAGARRYLVCANRYGRDRCPLPHVPSAPVEARAWEQVCRWLATAPPPTSLTIQREAQTQPIEAQIVETKQALARLLDLATRLKLPSEQAEAQLTHLAQQLERLEAHRGERTAPAEPPPALPINLARLTAEQRREVTLRLVARVVLAGSAPAGWQFIPVSHSSR